MNIKLLQDRVIVERVEPVKKTESGIIVPESHLQKRHEGKVIAAGPGLKSKSGEVIPMEVKEGDHVIFLKNAGSDIEIEGKTYLMMRESDIMGVIG